jgi:hypothetical protein
MESKNCCYDEDDCGHESDDEICCFSHDPCPHDTDGEEPSPPPP